MPAAPLTAAIWLALLLSVASAVPTPSRRPTSIPNPVAHLFRRQDGSPEPGSAAWRATFPTAGQIPTEVPDAWTRKYEEVKAQGLIPDLPVATLDAGGFPRYPNDAVTGRAPATCSHTHTGCSDEDDLEEAPEGIYALAFDDGPTPASVELYDFLERNDLAATHFMIGSNIVNNIDVFNQAFTQVSGEIAVHTWSHRFGITLTDEQLVAEIGWCMQAISDLTGGRVPSLIRPPYGDADARTKAIMKHVFGLRVVFWNTDSFDWCLTGTAGSSGTACSGTVATEADVAARLNGFVEQPKNPGLMVLQHEVFVRGLRVFMEEYPKMAQHGWTFNAIAEGCGLAPYQNSDGNDDDVTPMDILGEATGSLSSRITSTTSSPASTTVSSAPASSTSPVPGGAAAAGGDGNGAIASSVSLRLSLVAIFVALALL